MTEANPKIRFDYNAGDIISRILGYVRDQRMCFCWEASLLPDSFVLAYRIPNLISPLVGEGSMTASFIPVFTTLDA